MTESNHHILEAENVHFSYGTRKVLDGISIAIAPGEIFGLLGPNGSGKSTLLRLLCGFDKPSKGSFLFENETFQRPTIRFREQLGVVFQSPSLDEKLSAEKNLYLAGRIRGLSASYLNEAVPEHLDAMGLGERAKELVGTYSGGMKRRLDLARALLHHPSILLMDEPSSGLDEASFRGLWSLLNQIKETRSLTVLVATHRPEEAEYCHRLAVLAEGQVRQVETPENMRRSVANDILVFAGPNPEGLSEQIARITGLSPLLLDGSIHLECVDGHEWIPKIISELPKGAIQSVSLREPGLGDAFLKLTGTSLTADAGGVTP